MSFNPYIPNYPMTYELERQWRERILAIEQQRRANERNQNQNNHNQELNEFNYRDNSTHWLNSTNNAHMHSRRYANYGGGASHHYEQNAPHGVINIHPTQPQAQPQAQQVGQQVGQQVIPAPQRAHVPQHGPGQQVVPQAAQPAQPAQQGPQAQQGQRQQVPQLEAARAAPIVLERAAVEQGPMPAPAGHGAPVHAQDAQAQAQAQQQEGQLGQFGQLRVLGQMGSERKMGDLKDEPRVADGSSVLPIFDTSEAGINEDDLEMVDESVKTEENNSSNVNNVPLISSNVTRRDDNLRGQGSVVSNEVGYKQAGAEIARSLHFAKGPDDVKNILLNAAKTYDKCAIIPYVEDAITVSTMWLKPEDGARLEKIWSESDWKTEIESIRRGINSNHNDINMN